MANSLGTDIIIETPDPEAAAGFYQEALGFSVTGGGPEMLHIEGENINFYIERGAPLGPVFEVFVDDVAAAK